MNGNGNFGRPGFGQGGFGQGGFGGGHDQSGFGHGGGFGGSGQTGGFGSGFGGAGGFGAGGGQSATPDRSGFGGGFAPGGDDYRFGGPAPGGHSGPTGHKAPFGQRMASMRFFNAPVTILIAFAMQLVAAGVVIWRLVERWQLPERPTTGVGLLEGYEDRIASAIGANDSFRPENILETTIFWGIILVVLLLMAFFTVKGENWARIVLTLLCIAGVFLLAVSGFAIAGLACVITLPLLWVQVNKSWFGQV